MELQPTRYALLRDRRSWEAALLGLQLDADGALTLARVPGPADGRPIRLPPPYEVPPSGLAVGPCHELYLLDGLAARLIARDELCGSRRELPGCGGPGDGPGELRAPRALLLAGDALYLADAANGRIIRYRLPGLELTAIWGPPLLGAPVGLAGDPQGRIYVLDGTGAQVLRFGPWGAPDVDFNAALAAALPPVTPAALAVAGDTLFIADSAAGLVVRFDLAGAALAPFPPHGPARPRALAAGDGCLFFADAADGGVWAFDLAADTWLGTVAGFTGPVAAMAVGPGGELLIKPGQGETIVRLAAGAGCVAAGTLRAGPLDAGDEAGWGRVAARAEGEGVAMRLYTADDPGTSPAPADYTAALALDTLAPRAAPADEPPGSPSALAPRRGLRPRRHLWVEVELRSADRRTAPRLLQVQAESAGLGYLARLPEIYRRPERPEQLDFLHAWLELLRSALGDLGAELDLLARRFDYAVAPDDHLAWLASWLAFEPPAGADPARLRELIALLPRLYARRGTPGGLREQIRLLTGLRVQIVEGFTGRRIWQLGVTSALGFDTALPPAAPAGAVVPDEAAPLIVGDTRVGRAGPREADDLGAPLFADSAFSFSVIVPAGHGADPAARELLRRLIERERPAYTDYHLCVVAPLMRVGFQARLGVDTIVAGPPAPIDLAGSVLGLGSVLGEDDPRPAPGRVGERARLGRDTLVA